MIKRIYTTYRKRWRTFKTKNPHYIPHFNGKNMLNSAVLSTLGWYCFGLLWVLTAIEMGKTWICNHHYTEINNYFSLVEKYLADRRWFNMMITLTCIMAFIFWMKHVWDDCYLSLRRIVIAISLMTIFSFVGSFTSVHSFIKIDYAALCWYILLIQIVFDVAKLWNKRWGVRPSWEYGKRYITELPKEGLDKKVRLDYAKKVTEWLLNTDINESAFAVGITSEWGSGKTSFLLDMKKVIEGKCYMMDFKPWHCQTPDQIVNEFFELFRKEIKDIYSPLQKPILRYAQLLRDASLPDYVNPLFRLLPDMGHSIDEYKSKIEVGLKQLDKPVVVTIDDIDRLAADEMFEVLRLIRNTAAFPNLIFVVCYDKEYVVKQIQNKGIDESDLYLEKIFPLELSLPKTEDDALMETFRRALIEMRFMNGMQDKLISLLKVEDELIMVRLLPTYRKMKRFARVLMTNATFIIEKMGDKNVDLYDLFLIELVHFCMADVYMILRDRPEEMLEEKMDEGKRQARYYLRESLFTGDNILHLFNRNFKIYEEELLRKCFGERAGDKIHYLPYINSYLNYFCMATPSAMISKKEFKTVLNDRSNIRKNVHEWFNKIRPKKSASLYSRMMNERIRELTLDEWKGHVFLMVEWICEADDVQIKDVMRYFFQTDNLHIGEEDDDVIMNLYAKSKLERMIGGKKVKRMNVAKVLTGYYEMIEGDSVGYIIECEEVKELLKLNFLKFMEEKTAKQDAINVIALNGNDLHEFVEANSYTTMKKSGFGESSIFVSSNLIINAVIDYFGAYKEKSSHLSEAKKFYNDNKPDRYKTLSNITGINMNNEKNVIFGTEDNYKRFLKECFVDREKIK